MLAAISFLTFTGLVAVFTWWRTRREDLRHFEGYFLGGRSLSWIVIAGSLMMTNISTEQIVGLNGSAYSFGMSVMAWEVIAAIGLAIMALFLLPRYLRDGVTTIPEFLEERYSRGVRTMIAIVTVVTTIILILPFVLYTGALSFVSIFGLDRILGVSENMAVMVTVVGLALVGGAYAVAGGLKAVAISDTINGLGLLIGGTLVTVLAFLKLGEGSFSRACRILTEQRPDLLNAIGGEKSAVPFSSLFTALLLISVSYWGLNQFIIQRTFGARSLAEGQKGVLFAGLLKILGVGIVVFPGILAYHLFNGGLPHGDLAYPRLVKDVLPSPLMGFFSAVLFGAIITTFDSALHSLSTVLSVDIYKPLLRRQASDSEVVWAGKIVGIILIAFSVGIVPLISGSSEGVFNLMKRIGGYTAGPTTAITLMAFLHRRNPPWSAYIALPVGMIFYGLFTDVRGGLLCRWNGADVRLHWLHWYALSFFVVFALMLLVRWICPPATETEGVARPPPPGVDLRPWRYARPAALGLLAAVVLVYWFFSPLGVAR